MAYDIPANYGLLVLTMQNNTVAQPDTVRFGLKYIDASTMVTADFNRIANLFRDGLKASWDTNWNFGPVKQYYNSGGTLLLSEDPTIEAGTVGAVNYASDQVAIIMKKNTAFLGKAYRGRCFLPGVQETQVDAAGTIASGTVTALNTVFGTLLTNVNADADIDYMALLHVVPTGDIPAEITSLSCASKCGTVRRRVRR